MLIGNSFSPAGKAAPTHSAARPAPGIGPPVDIFEPGQQPSHLAQSLKLNGRTIEKGRLNPQEKLAFDRAQAVQDRVADAVNDFIDKAKSPDFDPDCARNSFGADGFKEVNLGTWKGFKSVTLQDSETQTQSCQYRESRAESTGVRKMASHTLRGLGFVLGLPGMALAAAAYTISTGLAGAVIALTATIPTKICALGESLGTQSGDPDEHYLLSTRLPDGKLLMENVTYRPDGGIVYGQSRY